MHKRLFPSINGFNYGLFYFMIPLSKLLNQPTNRLFSIDKFALFSIHQKDYAIKNKPSDNLDKWVKSILKNHDLDQQANGEIILVTLPKFLGYSFNPVNFYLCLDQDNKLKVVIAEVNNTFNERHHYLCFNDDLSEITSNTEISTKKLFHVSPFLEREGHYKFKFNYTDKNFGAWIDFYDKDNKKKLVTSLLGKSRKATNKLILKTFLNYPFSIIKVVFLIHFQALKIWCKKIKYIPKPKQLKLDYKELNNNTELNKEIRVNNKDVK